MKVNEKIIQALKSVEVILLAFLLVCFVIVQAVYPSGSWLQSIALTVVVLVIRVAFKVSESKGDTQVVD